MSSEDINSKPPSKPNPPSHPRKPRKKPLGIRLKNTVDMWHDGDMIWKRAKVVGKSLEIIGGIEFPRYSLEIGEKTYEASADELRIPNEKARLDAYIYNIYNVMQKFSELILSTKKQRIKQIQNIAKTNWFETDRINDWIDKTVCVESNGSGCIIETTEGPLVLTCAHCNMTERETNMEN